MMLMLMLLMMMRWSIALVLPPVFQSTVVSSIHFVLYSMNPFSKRDEIYT